MNLSRFFCALSSALCLSAPALAQTLQCPPTVQTKAGSLQLQQTPAGFAPYFEGGQLPLSGASIFDGPPEQGAQLQPAGGKGVLRWSLSDAQAGVWLSCDYAQGLFRLVQKLPHTPRSCSAKLYKEGKSPLLQAVFSCE
ncbi:STY0301 family protein [Massilia sp. W12]|uniref:STY0301 family protein n=1 Tax=Massilia sp. W12 TaxID=3126507 RepID=UPI0030CF1518